MTREEAIEMVNTAFEMWENEYDTGDDWSKEHEARDMAIKALEQEPCKDAISRREAIKKFTYNYKGERIPDYDCDNFFVQIAIKTVKKILRDLPSVNPQHTEAEIQKMQELEQAEIQRAYELGKAEQQTCEDAVSREAVLGLFAQNADAVRPYSKTWEEVKALPPVNPQQRLGHWIETQEKDDAEPFILWECSCCHKEFRGVVHKISNYCPNCGARMVERSEE